MINLIVNALYVFFKILEIVLFLYIISTWFHISDRFKNLFNLFLGPVLDPIRYLLKHSIFQVRNYDISPIICVIIIVYFQAFFKNLAG